MGQGTQREEAPEVLYQRAMQGYPQEEALPRLEEGDARSEVCRFPAAVQCGAEAVRNGAQSSSPGGDSAPEATEQRGSTEVGGSSSSGSRGGKGTHQGTEGIPGDLLVQWGPNWADNLKTQIQGRCGYHILTWAGSRLPEESPGELETTPTEHDFPLRIRFEVVNGLDTNLLYFHQFADFDDIPAGEFTKLKGWKKSCLFGKVEKHKWNRTGDGQTEEVLTVVKNMDTKAVERCRQLQANDRVAWESGMASPEDAMNEIGVYKYFQQQQRLCPYVLQMHGSFSNGTRTWLVLENCDGGDLFDWVERRRDEGKFGEQEIKRYVWQILKAVDFLHSHNVGHRDISLENLLLRNQTVRLMDFGQAVQLRAPDGTEYHYFRMSGKDYYRAPECYIPSSQTCPGLRVQAMCPSAWKPGLEVQVMGGGYLCLVSFPDTAVPDQPSDATLRGYTVVPVDVFATGVAFFILHAQVQPWKQALMAIPNFRFVYHNGIQALLKSFNKPNLSPEGSELLTGMLHLYAAYRWTVQQCLESAWFADLQADGV